MSFSFSFVLVKGFVKTFSPRFYKTTRGLLCKKDFTTVTKSTTNDLTRTYQHNNNNSIITTTVINNKTTELNQQNQQNQSQWLQFKLMKIRKQFEKAINSNNKIKVKNLFRKSKSLYKNHGDKIEKFDEGGINIISYLIKKDEINLIKSLIKYIDEKNDRNYLIKDFVYSLIELLKEGNFKRLHIIWNISLSNDNVKEKEKDLLNMMEIFFSTRPKPELIKDFLIGMISSGIKPTEDIWFLVTKRIHRIRFTCEEELLIEIYNLFKNRINLSNNVYKELLILQQKKQNINSLTFFYKDMIIINSKEVVELDQIGSGSLRLMENSFKEGKLDAAIKYFDEIQSMKIQSNPIILFELFKGLFEAKIESYKIFLLYQLIIKQKRIKINSDLGHYIIMGFLWNDRMYYAEQVLIEMIDSNMVPFACTFVSFVDSYLLKGMIDKAEKIVGFIKPICDHEYLRCLGKLLSHYNKQQDKKGILRWIDELAKIPSESVKEGKGYIKDTVLMYSYGILGKLPDTIKLWDEMNQKYSKENLSAAISILFDQIGFHGDLLNLKRYWKLISNNSNYNLNLNHYNSYIEALCRFNAFDDAIKIFKYELELKDLQPELKTIITLLTPLIIRKKYDESENILSFIKMKWPDLFDDFVQICWRIK